MNDNQIIEEFGYVDNFATPIDAERAVRQLRKLLKEGHGVAGFLLAMLVCPGLVAGAQEVKDYLVQYSGECEHLYRQSYPLLLANAESGSPEAMDFLFMYFQNGLPPVQVDMDQAFYWDRRARELREKR